ncbi:hypothetical protein [Paenibacillus protaetiae]|uniref:Uncharacterized protein n=1 Tax=Paenibacillus protaetiae TaxID=2509456 RepID=A0A4P6FCE2_9BACL|nr:hypothetical protein [Paenibacillus protaetiae]QAY68228.1 hypothetical protein ET464_19455 [Paenibacillus protaetiae]
MFCPVCNGLDTVQAVCPSCNEPADDWGRLSDLAGPYSPYESIGSFENRTSGQSQGKCSHVCGCQSCGSVFEIAVAEWQ